MQSVQRVANIMDEIAAAFLEQGKGQLTEQNGP
ncbi:MAG: hypothetical protein QOF46_1022 [Paraburkholderia sp.]|nr:hypothetical protein [Paraburkholderia sp.]